MANLGFVTTFVIVWVTKIEQAASQHKVTCPAIQIPYGLVKYRWIPKTTDSSTWAILPETTKIAIFDCHKGFRLEGNARIPCDNGVWNDTLPRCIEKHCSVTDFDHYAMNIQYELPLGSYKSTEGYKPPQTVATFTCKHNGFASQTTKCQLGEWSSYELECLRDSCQLNVSINDFNSSRIRYFDIPHEATGLVLKVRSAGKTEIFLSSMVSENGSYDVLSGSEIIFERKIYQFKISLCQKQLATNYVGGRTCSYRTEILSGNNLTSKFRRYWIQFGSNTINALDPPYKCFKHFMYPEESSANILFCNFVYDSDVSPTSSPEASSSSLSVPLPCDTLSETTLSPEGTTEEKLETGTYSYVSYCEEQGLHHPDQNLTGFGYLDGQLCLVHDILSQVNVTSKAIRMAAEIVENVTKNVEFVEGNQFRLQLILSSVMSVVAEEDSSEEVTGSVVRTINNVMDFDDYILRSILSETARFVSALEQQIGAFQTKDGNFSKILSNIGILAVKIYSTSVDDNLTLAYIGKDDKSIVDGEFLLNKNTDISNMYEPDDEKRILTAVSVPADFLGLPTGANENFTKIPVSFIIYRNDKLFVPYKPAQHVEKQLDKTESTIKTESIASQVVSVRIEDKNNEDILSQKPAVFAKFLTNVRVNTEEKVESQHCVSWEYDDETGKGFWSKDGCDTLLDDQEKKLTACSFKRLTSFAVLVRVRKGYYKSSLTLYFITLIGSIISATCLVLCLVTFVSLKKLRSKQPTHIHINLCTSLLGFYLVFMFSQLAGSNWVSCSILSAAIHFFCLATVFWMSVEAINMYCTFVRMKQSGIRFFLPIACLFAYGCSAVTTILVAIFDKSSDYKNVQYCFLQPGMALYFGFLTEVALSFLLNAIIAIFVVRKVLCRPLMVSRTTENARRKEIITRMRHCVTFWFVLGLSWVFGFLAAADSKTEIFLYLFCICISVQGLIMFLMLCICNPEFRDVVLKLFPSRSASTTIKLTNLSQSHTSRHNFQTGSC